MNLNEFLIKAKVSGYATGGEGKEIKLDDGGLKFLYKENDLVYSDIYYGFNPFAGQELVRKGNKVIWMLNYYGKSFYPQDEIIQIYRFLKKALQKPENGLPLRGPKKFSDNNFEYSNIVNGDMGFFSGKEEILEGEKLIYELYYHGGNL